MAPCVSGLGLCHLDLKASEQLTAELQHRPVIAAVPLVLKSGLQILDEIHVVSQNVAKRAEVGLKAFSRSAELQPRLVVSTPAYARARVWLWITAQIPDWLSPHS